MNEEKLFIDKLIEESEQRNKKLEQAHLDLILVEIKKNEEQIEKNFDTASFERELVKNWALERNTMLNGRIEWLSKKLEKYLKEEKLKSLDLAHGVIKIRKQQDKIVIIDEEKFLNNATSKLLSIIETVKPDMLKVRAFIKNSGRIPEGVEVTPQEEKFSYTIKKIKEMTNGKIRSTDKSASAFRTAI